MSFLDTRHKKKSFTLTTLLLSVLLLVLFYIGLTYMDPPEENGISINFGTTVMGGAVIEPGTTVLPLSLVLKGMQLPAGVHHGSPAEPACESRET